MRPMPATFEAPAEIRIDVSENDKAYEVRAEVPGAKKNDIRATIDGNFVSISAEVKREKEDRTGNGARAIVKELYYSSASRGFSLAQAVDSKASFVRYEDGVLKLSLPKLAEATTKTLKIE